MRKLLGVLIFSLTFLEAAEEGYPPEWWAPVDPANAPTWEILPQSAGPGEVVLSKRTELGIFSNFAATAFRYKRKKYASVEGFWQMMKFPDAHLDQDPRKAFPWTLTRDEVANLAGFEAKDAGNEGSQVMKELDINWVSFRGRMMEYRTQEKGEHYDLIKGAMEAKLDQTKGLKELLLSTGNLKLIPDHDQGEAPPPAWKYYEIWMEFRESLRNN